MKSRQQQLLKILSGLFLLAVVALVWRPGDATAVVVPKVFEPLIGLIGFGVLYYFLRYGISESIRTYWKALGQRHVLLFGTFLIFASIGFLFAIFQGADWYPSSAHIALEFMRIIFVLVFFFISVVLLLDNQKLIHLTLFAIAISPLIFPVLYFFGLKSLLLDGWRLRGIGADPNYTATWLLIALAISLAFSLRNMKGWQWGLVNVVFLTTLLIWTGSRGGWLAAFVVSALICLGYLGCNISKLKIIRAGVVAFVLLMSVVIGFSVLPKESQLGVSQRSLEALVEPNKSIFYGQDRGTLWKLAVERLKTNPFGSGPAFARWQPLATFGERDSGTHNMWLEIALTAGWGGLAVTLVFFVPFMRASWQMLFDRQWEGVAIGAGILGLFTALFFLDGLTLRWLWLMMALSTAYAFHQRQSKS